MNNISSSYEENSSDLVRENPQEEHDGSNAHETNQNDQIQTEDGANESLTAADGSQSAAENTWPEDCAGNSRESSGVSQIGVETVSADAEDLRSFIHRELLNQLSSSSNRITEELRNVIRAELLEQLSFSSDQITAEFADLRSVLAEGIDKDKQLEKKEELFLEVHAELKKYKMGMERSLLAPLLKTAIDWYQRVCDMCRFYEAKSPRYGQEKKNYGDLLREFSNFGEYILDSLENFDVQIISPAENTPFDRYVHEAVEAVKTDDQSLDNLIKQCFTAGFKYSDGKIIKYAKVAVYKYGE